VEANYYDILGVPPSASAHDIRRAYLNLIREVHPDRNARPDAAARAARFNAVYGTLSDPEKRAAYDARLRAGGTSGGPGVRTAPAAPGREKPKDRGWWMRAAAAAAVMSCVLLALIYAAASNPPAEVTVPPPWARVAALVAKLNGIVLARTPVAATHVEDGVIVTDFALDRSKFDAQELNGIAADIRRELDESPTADDFMARAYFNARLLAVSVDVLARLDRGESISRQIAEVRTLGESGSVQAWLDRSPFASPYRDLVDRLVKCGDEHETGRPSAELAADLKWKDDELARVRARMDADKRSGNLDSYDAQVAAHNQLADETNAMVRVLVARSKIAEELDLAFNRALDPATIFGSPGRLDVSGRAAGGGRIPE
jgi:curved DNA-binding protein CbpA